MAILISLINFVQNHTKIYFHFESKKLKKKKNFLHELFSSYAAKQLEIAVCGDTVYYRVINGGWGQTSLDSLGTPNTIFSSNALTITSKIKANSDGTTKINKLIINSNDGINLKNRVELKLDDSDLRNF